MYLIKRMWNWLPALLLLVVQGSANPEALQHRADLLRYLASHPQVFSISLKSVQEARSDESSTSAESSRAQTVLSSVVCLYPCDTVLAIPSGLGTCLNPRDGPRDHRA
ncbi:MAG: hypothetical protein LCH41_04525 [Armatimonadetes bacterium]|nr:hypothetical protein [Armatimonadota bacterium]